MQIKVLFFKILCAFEAIHGLGVVHNDIKPNNLMLVKTDDDAFDVRVIDFGLSEFIGLGPTKRLSRHYRCTEFTKAPDDSHSEETYNEGLPKYFKGNRKSFASDVYSIAVSMVTLIVGTDAVRSVRRTNYNTLTVGNYTYACPDPRLEDLLLQMLHNVASARTTCEAALRHPYFTGRQPFGNAFSNHFSNERSPNRVLTYVKSALKMRSRMFERPYKIFVWGP